MTTQNAQTGPVAEERPPAPPGSAGERLAELPNPAQIDALLADAEGDIFRSQEAVGGP